MNFRLVSKLLAVVSMLIGVTMIFSLPWAAPSLGYREPLERPDVFESGGFGALLGHPAYPHLHLVLGLNQQGGDGTDE